MSVGQLSLIRRSESFIVGTAQQVDEDLSDDDLHAELRASFGSYASTAASESEAWGEEEVEELSDSEFLLNEPDCFAWPVDTQIDLDACLAERSNRSVSGLSSNFQGRHGDENSLNVSLFECQNLAGARSTIDEPVLGSVVEYHGLANP